MLVAALCWIFIAMLGATSCQAQQNLQYTQNNRDLGMRIDARIDPATLGMSLVIPLADYPGRAGNNFPVALYYNSKVWRLNYNDYVNGNMVNCVNNPDIEAGTECYTTITPEYAENSVAGWTFSSGFPSVGNGAERYNVDGFACCSGDPNQGRYIARLTVRFPSGAIHELRRSDAVLSGTDNFIGTYHAVDSSRLKYVTTQAGTGNLYLPDGSRYEVQNWTATKLIDRNGNVILSQTDTLGRQIVAPTFHNSFVHSETHSIPGVNGTSMSYTFELAELEDVLDADLTTGQVPVLHRVGDTDKFGNAVYSPSLFNSETGSRVIGGSLTFNPTVLRRITLPNGTSYTFGYNQYGEITRVVYPTGGYERFRYGSLTPLGAIGSPYSQGNRGVVERRVSATGLAGAEVTWTYSSTGTAVTTTAPDGTVTVRYLIPTAQAGTVVFGLEDPRAGMVYDERVYAPAAQGGAMLRRALTNWDYSGPLSGGHATAKRNPRVNRQVDIILDTGGNALATATEMDYDADLNVISTRRYGFVSLSQTTAQTAAITAISNGTLLRTEETDYLTNNTDYRDRHLVTLPVATRVLDGAGNLVAQSSISYDETSFPLLTYGHVTGWLDPGTNARGNATTVSTWLSTTNSYSSVHTQYDQCGSVRNVWDARDTDLSNPSRIEYAGTHQRAYPTSTFSADPDGGGPLESLSSTTEFDSTTGLVTAEVEANGQKTTFSYNDPLNRLKQVIRAATDPTAKTQTSYSYDDAARTITVTSDLNSFDDNVLKSMTLLDGLGRAIESRTYEDGTNYIVHKTQYDILGRPFKTSNPHRQNETAVWTTQTFDGLGRVISVMTPDNAVVSSSYSGTSLTVTDQAGKARKSVTDALGRLIEIYEDPSGVNYQTTYSYDALDNLVGVTQGAQTRTFVYDSLKRLTTAINPESGTVNYQYDNNGNLLVKTDARNVSAHYEYDRLNRLTRRWYNRSTSTLETTHNIPALPAAVGATSESKYFYDSQPLPSTAPLYSRGSSLGRLVAQTYGGGTNGDYFAYDVLGRTTLKFQQTGTVNYKIEATYNRASSRTLLKYPSDRTVNLTYDQAGRLSSLGGNLGGAPRTYSTGILYSPFGAIVKEQFGTDTTIYNKLFYNVRGQLAEIRESTTYSGPTDFTANLGAIVNGYSTLCTGICSGVNTPDNNGNLRSQQILIPGYDTRVQHHDYDSLSRLSSASEFIPTISSDPQWKQEFAYDRWGNRTIKNTTTDGLNKKEFTVDETTNRLAVPVGQSGVMEYDEAGNLKNDTYTGAGERKYDAENKITYAWGNNQAQLYAYDASGNRIKRTVDGVETWQVYGFSGELLAEYPAGDDDTPQKEFGYRNGQLLITAEPVTVPVNVASAANGATATASSSFSGFAASGAINGDRKGLYVWQNGYWSTASAGFPAWLEVQFSGSKTIREIDVFTLQDNYNAPVEPTESMTFSVGGLTGYEVQYWTGSAWAPVPDTSVNGNNRVWKKFTFAPLTTTKIRVLSSSSPDNYSRLTEVEAWTGPSPAPRYNLALGSMGASATASNSANAGYGPTGANNGDRKSLNWTNGGGWNDSGPPFPDWLQIDFGAVKTINEVDVFTLQDNWANAAEPTASTTFTLWGLTGYEVQYWNGSNWIAIPGASVTGNDKIWLKFQFSPIATSKIRVLTNASVDGYSRITEVEAYGPADTGAFGGVYWLVSDHLGSPRMIFDQSGELANVSRHDYLPFGEELVRTEQGYQRADKLRQHFTAKERDIETGLDYFIHRYRSSIQGRFTSADAPFADQSDGDPQSWNLYTYAGNNPLMYTDPSGRWKWVDPENNGKRFIQWEEGDTWETLSEFLYKETGRDYYSTDLKKAYGSGGLGANTIVDFSGAPKVFFTNNRGGLVDTSMEFYLTVLPAAKAVQAVGGLAKGALQGATGFFAKGSARAAAQGVLTGSLKGLTQAERSMVQELLASGKNVQIIARGAGKTADFVIDGAVTELKTLTAAGTNTLKNAIQNASKQGQHILVDARNVGIDPADALQQILRAEGNIGGLQGRVTVLTKGGTVTY
ncbi:MAG TPA: discoidin domain-containing protein [Pyrinomonadaceae bacterium]|nr:discoidin domain-containing protein [Pyrinomonadaceae bacterium]